MRPLVLAGVVVLGLGAFLLIRGGTFTTRKDVLKVGDVRITAPDREEIPPWVGGGVAVLGVALIAAGARKNS